MPILMFFSYFTNAGINQKGISEMWRSNCRKENIPFQKWEISRYPHPSVLVKKLIPTLGVGIK